MIKGGYPFVLLWLSENVSSYGREIDRFFDLIHSITGVTFVLVAGAMVLFLMQQKSVYAGS